MSCYRSASVGPPPALLRRHGIDLDGNGCDLDEEAEQGRRRGGRRLPDKILVAFHQSCDQRDFEVAECLLHVVEMMLKRRPPPMLEKCRRRNPDEDTLVGAYARLWQLRHPDELP